MVQKRTWKQVDGVLLLDKPSGMTSNDALQKARRLFSAAKAGHTGTLDPLASGLLPLCFGEATKFAADLLEADKTYLAELGLGVTTTTGDKEGEVLETRPVQVPREQLEAVLPRFVGAIQQVPPMYSALKRDGRPLYELARAGIEVERAPRAVTIHELKLVDFHDSTAVLAVSCSKGTYVRTLAEDVGRALGCGAHLTALRRTRVGKLGLGEAYTLEQLAAFPDAPPGECLKGLDYLLEGLPRADLTEAAVLRFSHGNGVECPGPEGRLRVYDPAGRLLGIGECREGVLQPKRLLRQEEGA